jgi:predicted metal-dependent phosphoesterase TrpH
MSSSHGSRFPGAGLLCELHAHSRWSDGDLDLPVMVDLYGSAGFDVLCVTDHVARGGTMITVDVHAGYLEAITREAARAAHRYGMLVLPGLELTWDDEQADRAAHAVAVGIDRFVGLEDGIDAAVETARDLGAAIIAAHPHGARFDSIPGRTTQRWRYDAAFRALAHRFELINRTQVFEWVAEAGLSAVANGDFHRAEHLATWKTVLPVERDAAAVVEYLRSPMPAMLTRPAVAAMALESGDMAA